MYLLGADSIQKPELLAKRISMRSVSDRHPAEGDRHALLSAMVAPTDPTSIDVTAGNLISIRPVPRVWTCLTPESQPSQMSENDG